MDKDTVTEMDDTTSEDVSPVIYACDGYTPLTFCVELGLANDVQRLIRNGADINQPDNFTHSRSPLITAISRRNIVMVQLLIELGADVNLMVDGICPIHAACRMNSFMIVEALVEKGADVNVPDEYGYTPLDIALNFSSGRNEKIIDDLLIGGAKVDLLI